MKERYNLLAKCLKTNISNVPIQLLRNEFLTVPLPLRAKLIESFKIEYSLAFKLSHQETFNEQVRCYC